MEFRTRQIIGHLKKAGKVQLICSEYKKSLKGHRKYLASNDLDATPRQVLIAYRIRWEIEIFHKMIKMHLGFEEVAPKSFKSVISHVHWVYCSYILLNWKPPGIPDHIKSIAEKQRIVKLSIHKKHISQYIQILTRINGGNQLKSILREALEQPNCTETSFL